MTRFLAYALSAGIVLAGIAGAKAQQDPGARAGSSYVPSTHTAGCAGVLCDGNDPERAVGAPPPPPCQGLLCSVSPYSMQRPVTASEAQRVQEEQSRAAPAPAPVEAAAKPAKRHKAKSKSVKARAAKEKAVAARTPDPAPAAQ